MSRIIEDVKLDYADVLLVPQDSQISSRVDVQLETQFCGVLGIAIIGANMDGVGTFKMAESLAKHKMFTCLTKHHSVDDLVRFYTDKANADIIPYTIYSMGANVQDLEKFKLVQNYIEGHEGDFIAQTEPNIICIDVANGYTNQFKDFVYRMREQYPNKYLIVGNVCTPDTTYDLIKAGANYVKIGVGPGSVCTTRIKAGTGYPQFSAVFECVDAAYNAHGGIIADGGCTNPGDVAKAFGAGASAVMLGGMLAGHIESFKEYPFINGFSIPNNKIKFYGMASKVAQDKHNGGVKDYRASEGREVEIPYRGPVENTVLDILGGLRSAMTYSNAKDMEEFAQCAVFAKVNHQYNKVFE